MIEIFRDRSPVKVGYYKTILEENGILVFMRNNNLSVVEAPIPVFYPALCVMNDEDHQRAVEILKELIAQEQTETNAPEQPCPSCSEMNPANFEICWSCGAELELESLV